MPNQTDRAAMISFLVRWTSLWNAHNAQTAIKNQADLALKDLDAHINDCRAAFRLMGHDANDPESWKLIQAEYADEWRKAWDEVNAQPPPPPTLPLPSLDGETEKIQLMGQAQPMPKISDIVLEMLKLYGAEGSKASVIRRYIEDTYSKSLHEKTIGMTLFRLSKKGLVRRVKQTWFFVPQDADAKDPGASTPGQLEFME